MIGELNSDNTIVIHKEYLFYHFTIDIIFKIIWFLFLFFIEY